MYTQVGIFDAKTTLPKLLCSVEQEASIANWIPSSSYLQQNRMMVAEAMQNITKVVGVNGDEITTWVINGRT